MYINGSDSGTSGGGYRSGPKKAHIVKLKGSEWQTSGGSPVGLVQVMFSLYYYLCTNHSRNSQH
jgi:hypothetical protein